MINSREVNKAVIPVAGLGKRMFPVTKGIPKEMLPLVTTPIIQLIVEEIVLSGIEEIILITNKQKDTIEQYLKKIVNFEKNSKINSKNNIFDKINFNSNSKIKISSLTQDKPLGLGHAVLCSKPLVKKEPFALVLPDMIFTKNNKKNNLSKMKQNYEKTGNYQILLGKINIKESNKYGMAKVFENYLDSIIEKPESSKSPSNLCATGRYILDDDIFEVLENSKPDSSGEIQLTQALSSHINKKNKIGVEILQGEFYDCGDKLGYLKAIVTFGLKDSLIKKDFKHFLKKLS
tara:strand:- start:3914 stop:4783 length:870 start_codon:yes stop_codon:yes gene_type:complete